MNNDVVTALVGLVMIVGLVGTVAPLVPGVALIWLAALGYGLVVGFGPVGMVVMVLLTVIAVVSLIKSVVVPRRMAQGYGVSSRSQLVALFGAIVGLAFIPVVGIVVGALGGLFLAEVVRHRNGADAWRATIAVAKGFGLSALIDVALATVMIAAWSFWALAVVT